MFIGFEQSIINKDFVHIKNHTNLLSFHKKTDILSQINLSFNNGIYTISFPIDDIHYSTTFTDKKNLMKYMNFIIHSHKF
tara:strand:- start:638 stop:877 length:240 start_codon:yes stop_codon:yes gene_type:complete